MDEDYILSYEDYDSSDNSDFLYKDSNGCGSIQVNFYANKRQKVSTDSDIPLTSNAITKTSTSQTTTIVIIENTNSSFPNLSSEDTQCPEITEKPKKRKIGARKELLDKEKKLRSHTSGPPCNCSLLKCSETISTEERSQLLSSFNNDFANLNEQNAFLSSLISALPTKRPNSSQFPSKRRVFSYEYQVPVIRKGIAVKHKVCHKAFMSIFGITNRRTQTIKLAVATTGIYAYCTNFLLVVYLA